MPKATAVIALVYTLWSLLCSSFAFADVQNCALAGAPSWYRDLRTVLADCDNRIASPSGQLVLRIDPTGAVRVLQQASGKLLAEAPGPVQPPAMTAWSPSSGAFFINDGNGSGETSQLRLYVLKGGRITESDSVQRSASDLYRARARCAQNALDPDVWGLRWTSDGQYLDLLVEATVHRPCGEPGAFLGMRVRASDAKVVEVLSESATVTGWSAWLPKGLKSREGTAAH
jgi:hypothetical protein